METITKNCRHCNKEFKKISSDSKKYWIKKSFCSVSCAGKHNVPAKKLKGTKRPKEVIEKLKPTMFKKGQKPWNYASPYYQIRGEKHPLWKGGVSAKNRSERYTAMQTLEYKLWRRSVFEGDNFICVWCGIKGGKLEADHIQRWVDRPDLRYAIDNGRTLCQGCHRKRKN